jgi:hypothetical protein
LHAVTDFLNKMESNFQILVSFPSVSILFIRRFVSSSDHSENFTILNRLYLRCNVLEICVSIFSIILRNNTYIFIYF